MDVEVREHVLEIYEMIFQDLKEIPEHIWINEEFAIDYIHSFEEMKNMLSFFSEEEMYEKCITVKKWLDDLESTYALLHVKHFLKK